MQGEQLDSFCEDTTHITKDGLFSNDSVIYQPLSIVVGMRHA